MLTTQERCYFMRGAVHAGSWLCRAPLSPTDKGNWVGGKHNMRFSWEKQSWKWMFLNWKIVLIPVQLLIVRGFGFVPLPPQVLLSPFLLIQLWCLAFQRCCRAGGLLGSVTHLMLNGSITLPSQRDLACQVSRVYFPSPGLLHLSSAQSHPSTGIVI